MIEIYTSPTCQPCKVLKTKLATAGLTDKVAFLDVSNPEHRKKALDLSIQRVPTIIYDGTQITEEELFAKLS